MVIGMLHSLKNYLNYLYRLYSIFCKQNSFLNVIITDKLKHLLMINTNKF